MQRPKKSGKKACIFVSVVLWNSVGANLNQKNVNEKRWQQKISARYRFADAMIMYRGMVRATHNILARSRLCFM